MSIELPTPSSPPGAPRPRAQFLAGAWPAESIRRSHTSRLSLSPTTSPWTMTRARTAIQSCHYAFPGQRRGVRRRIRPHPGRQHRLLRRSRLPESWPAPITVTAMAAGACTSATPTATSWRSSPGPPGSALRNQDMPRRAATIAKPTRATPTMTWPVAGREVQGPLPVRAPFPAVDHAWWHQVQGAEEAGELRRRVVVHLRRPGGVGSEALFRRFAVGAALAESTT